MLLSILVIGSLSTLSSAHAQTPTRGVTFESVVTYSDGTVRVVQPRWNGLRINNGSDRHGVCKLLGYPAALSEAEFDSNTGRDNCDRPAVRVDRNGRDAGRNACDGMFNTNATVAAVYCQPVGYDYAVPPTYLERVENEDGTVSIINPWLSRADDQTVPGRRYINEASDPNGVCRHFGLGAYVDGSLVAEDRCEMPARRGDLTVRLDGYGRIKRFDDCDQDMIIYISCRRR